VQVAVANAAK